MNLYECFLLIMLIKDLRCFLTQFHAYLQLVLNGSLYILTHCMTDPQSEITGRPSGV